MKAIKEWLLPGVVGVLGAVVVGLALLSLVSGCGAAQMAGMYPGNWVDGPDQGRKVFCVGSDKSINCDWVGYHLRDKH